MNYQFESPLAGTNQAKKLREKLTLLDRHRSLNREVRAGVPLEQVAALMKLSLDEFSQMHKQAVKAKSNRVYPNSQTLYFSSATPYEICERFAAGMLNSDEVIAELSVWEYAEPEPNGHEIIREFRIEPLGSFADVDRARKHRLIGHDFYNAIYSAVFGKRV